MTVDKWCVSLRARSLRSEKCENLHKTRIPFHLITGEKVQRTHLHMLIERPIPFLPHAE